MAEVEQIDLLYFCRIERTSSASSCAVPYVMLHVLGTEIFALLGTGGSISLIGDQVFHLCQRRNVQLAQCNTRLRATNGTLVTVRAAVHLKLSLISKICRQRFIYCPGLAVPMLLGRTLSLGKT